jgi:serine/threonine protein phosphatase 1
VHAGLRPHVPLADQDAEDMLWIRDGFLETGYNFGKLVVHGHTALDHPTLYETRLNIDGGAGYGRPLVPIALNGTSCWTLTANGRQPLTLA